MTEDERGRTTVSDTGVPRLEEGGVNSESIFDAKQSSVAFNDRVSDERRVIEIQNYTNPQIVQ